MRVPRQQLGSRIPRLRDEQVAEIRRLRNEGLSLGKISRATGVSETRVGKVVNRRGIYR